MKGSIQNSPRHSSLLNEMECDEDQGIGDSNKSFNSADAIVKEARTVYNQLKMLHFTLKGNQDGDSGTHSENYMIPFVLKYSSFFGCSRCRFAFRSLFGFD